MVCMALMHLEHDAFESTSSKVPDPSTSKDADATSRSTAHGEQDSGCDSPKAKDHKSRCDCEDQCSPSCDQEKDWGHDLGHEHDRTSRHDHDNGCSLTVDREHGHKCDCSPDGQPSLK